MATISINNLAKAIYESGKDKSGTDLAHVMENATKFLAEKHMLGKAPQILEVLENITDSHDGIVRVKISSKEKLSNKLKDEAEEIVKKRYKAKVVYLEEYEDKNLLGGIKIEVGDEIINMTLRNKLDKLQNYLIES